MPTSGRVPWVQTSTTLELLLRSLWAAEDGVDGLGFGGGAAGNEGGPTNRACVNKVSKSSNRLRRAKVAGSKLWSLSLV